MFLIDYYRTEDGRTPVMEFIDSLDPAMRTKAFASIQILAERGNELRMPFSRAVGDGLFELRIQFSNDITRIFYFFFVGRRIILTNGFIKKTMKMPREEFERAKKYKRDFERRNH